ncbi:MAG: uL15 family ribosomal protein [Candidatus Pacebacteria bacterium]|jgi:large subunit ribosomal protein L15|nr:uL15 family ribosomal protein [Candidatus Paceibacterota bacterium]MBP9818710.1 uL15 family ribosomal protein [Candidatus Paceibacterota bacterium]
MQTHNLKRKTENMKKIQVGRGGKRGKTSGRGTKGQKARAGHKIRPEIRDMIKRLPKLRGRGVNSNKSIQKDTVPLNLSSLEIFKANEIVSPKTIVDKGILPTVHGRYPRVKILSLGEVTVAVRVRDCEVSAGAKAKIEKVGGTIEA